MHDRPRRLMEQDVEPVAALARTVWQATYSALISQAQIDAMLADRYAPARIHGQLDEPHHAWWVIGTPPIAFAHACLTEHAVKLDKLYVHPDHQRQGLGAMLLDEVADWARTHGRRVIRLQVNRGNTPARQAYEKHGFRVVESRVFEIGGGFVMDDHVMERQL